MNESWSAVSVGSMNLMLSICGRRGTWEKWVGLGWAHICWWIWKAALRRSFQALSTYVVVISPKPCRVLVSRESAAEDRQGFSLVLALAVSARELASGEVQVPFHSGSRWGLLRRPVRSARHRTCSCGDRYGCFCCVWSWMSRRKLGISVSNIESLESLRAGHGQLQIQCRSESVACGSDV